MNIQRWLRESVIDLDAESGARALRIWRAVFAVAVLLQALWAGIDLPVLAGPHGLMLQPINDAMAVEATPRLGWLSGLWMSGRISEESVLYACFALYCAALSYLALGWKPRLAAGVALLMHLVFRNSGAASIYGAHEVATNGLFFCLVMPVSSMPVDPFQVHLSRVVLRAYLSLVYFSSGFAKIQGEPWRNGDAMWVFLTRPEVTIADFTWLSAWPWLPLVAGWFVLVTEIGYPVVLFAPSLRRWVLWAIAALHLGIALTMQLWCFSAVMIAMNLGALGRGQRRSVETAVLSPRETATLAARFNWIYSGLHFR